MNFKQSCLTNSHLAFHRGMAGSKGQGCDPVVEMRCETRTIARTRRDNNS